MAGLLFRADAGILFEKLIFELIQNFLSSYGLVALISLAALAFLAGFIDAIVGGGGLIQIPSLLINIPQASIPTLFGTNKIASLAGTSVAALKYARTIKFDYLLLLILALGAGLAAVAGAAVVRMLHPDALKPIVLIILIAIFIYTIFKKNLGAYQTKSHSRHQQIIFGAILAVLIGFYDGFFGPGTGNFLVLGLVTLLGFEFLKASAYAKIINCLTDFGALIIFVYHGNYLIGIAILMGIFNVLGAYLGAHLAIKNGNRFIRIVFLIVVALLIARYGYDVVMYLQISSVIAALLRN